MDWNSILNPGRRRTSSQQPSTDFRTEFERDYGRIVFSTPVRRLQDKAQVFPLEPHDGVRTRLTHSLEVSTLSRNIASAICRALVVDGSLRPEQTGDVVEIAASAGLLHDIGNPPFGHAGEQAMRDWLRRRMLSDDLRPMFSQQSPRIPPTNEVVFQPIAQDFISFDGNAQTIRLVSRLQVLSDEFGLNLTYGTLSAACKYVVSSHAIQKNPHSHSKPGYFDTEREVIAEVQAQTGTGVARNPITFMVEAADDIINAVVDLEDGLKKRLYSWTELKGELSRLSNSQAIEALITDAESLVDASGLEGKAREDACAQALRTKLVGVLAPSVVKQFLSRYGEIMAGEFGDELSGVCDLATIYLACKSIVQTRVFTASDVLRLEVMGRRIIWDLMDLYWEGTQWHGPATNTKEFPSKLRRLISANYQHVYTQHLEEVFPAQYRSDAWIAYLRLRLVCDQVCGMTDTFAAREHKRLTNG